MSESHVCTDCGHGNRSGARFCGGCGLPITDLPRCRACGAENPHAQRFCDACGAVLGMPSGPTRTAELFSDPSSAPGAGGGSTSAPTSFGRGRYKVERFLGEGGRKVVYLAHDEQLDREVAVALIKTEGLDAAGIARVRREAQAMGRLGDHPHIVTVYDIGEEAGRPYIVSQYRPAAMSSTSWRSRKTAVSRSTKRCG